MYEPDTCPGTASIPGHAEDLRERKKPGAMRRPTVGLRVPYASAPLM